MDRDPDQPRASRSRDSDRLHRLHVSDILEQNNRRTGTVPAVIGPLAALLYCGHGHEVGLQQSTTYIMAKRKRSIR